jgi:hypothetical protein
LALVAIQILVVPAALASQSWVAFENPPTGVLGGRATIWSPDSTTVRLFSRDFFLSSSYADDNSGPRNGVNLIQQGIVDEYKSPQGPTCNLGTPYPVLYYFAETQRAGIDRCFNEGTATWDQAHLESVVLGNDNYWRPYIDGVFQNIRVQWTNSNCGYNACEVDAFGEEANLFGGHWDASFSGPGQTPMQYWDGTHWNEVESMPPGIWGQTTDHSWSFSGPFPGGVWTMSYDRS